MRHIYSDEIMTSDWLAQVAMTFPRHFWYSHGALTSFGNAAQCKSILRNLIKPARKRPRK